MERTSYDAAAVERHWYPIWEEKGYFRPSGNRQTAPYCIMIPPPNVTGTLHMGHAFQNTLMDALIRHHRMRGEDVLWQTGTDHAGIATQMVVERQLEAEGKRRHQLGRERFIERVWRWRESSGGTIARQLRRLGASCDWQRECFTMDRELSQSVTEAFVRLYGQGLIYRGKRLVNWDPILHTALSDLEVISEEEQGSLWHLRYPLADGDGYVVVATTRPETMLGDTAVAVHPDDERYRSLVGRQVRLPLSDRLIPIIADTYVNPEFGSGCVKITPAHDFNDYEVGKRHDLPIINIFTADAAINDNGPAVYRGMDRYVARQRIIDDLTALELIDRIDAHLLMVPRGDRTNAVVEPYLTDQWFVRVAPLADKAIQAVEQGDIRFVPESWSKTYFEWMRHIQDWCISRQIWWGHRIPAWYGPDGHVFVCRCEEEVYEWAAEHYGKPVKLVRDPDVLDTWFSSALWPFSTLGWPRTTPELKCYYPTNVLVTGFDIIFFWVARMIMMGLHFTGEVPFREVYVTGLIRDAEGNKMSKSKGNIIDPLDLIDGITLDDLLLKRTRDMMQPHLAEKIADQTRREYPNGIPAFGTDALRFTMASLATQGRDIKFDLARVEGYRNFCNKLWNASRFVLMHLADSPIVSTSDWLHTMPHHWPNLWIVSRLQRLIGAVDQAFADYRFNDAASELYQFLWGEYCDWYLELSKPILYNQTTPPELRQAVQYTMGAVLEQSLRLLHPLMPFITEELWQKVAPLLGLANGANSNSESIMLAPWPQQMPQWLDEQAEAEMAAVIAFVSAVRNIRGEMNVPPGQEVTVLVQGDAAALARLRHHDALIRPLARIADWQDWSEEPPAGCATAVLEGGVRLFVPLAGLIDPVVELGRLEKNRHKLEQELERCRGKLANAAFLDKAKPEVIDKERARQQELESKRAGLLEAIERIQRLSTKPIDQEGQQTDG
ncbi:MAG: valine--tRNA ligase [Magnetococcales bacterium]|nr:valine--tRNA ligase [Magnetococcales bacterium]